MKEKRVKMHQESRTTLVLTFVFLILSLLSSLNPQLLMAQSEPEYKMEIGGEVGLKNYLGDFNGSLFKCLQPAASVVWRYCFNPRNDLKLDLGYGLMKGSSANCDTFYPEIGTKSNPSAEPYTFKNNLFDLNCTYEYNFWPYGTGKEYRGAKRFTPFVLIGVGMDICSGGGNTMFAANLPVGVGVKYKVARRLNLQFHWAMHFTIGDKLDGYKDPYQIKSSGPFHNCDLYGALMIGLTYSFAEKCRVCHNSDE